MRNDDMKAIVADGYDRIADDYLGRFGQSSVRDAMLAELLKKLPARAMVLDLGCGAGEPVAREFVAHGFEVTGVDASPGQIMRARRNVPEANFVHADMTSIQLPARPVHANGPIGWSFSADVGRNKRP
jgi:ubiquinone/menaquinone biosynthesis C-methylase UbiE